MSEYQTHCVVLTNEGKSCMNEIYQGFTQQCFKHWSDKANSRYNDNGQREWKGFSIKPLDCEFCKITIVEHIYAEHQKECKHSIKKIKNIVNKNGESK